MDYHFKICLFSFFLFWFSVFFNALLQFYLIVAIHSLLLLAAFFYLYLSSIEYIHAKAWLLFTEANTIRLAMTKSNLLLLGTFDNMYLLLLLLLLRLLSFFFSLSLFLTLVLLFLPFAWHWQLFKAILWRY